MTKGWYRSSASCERDNLSILNKMKISSLPRCTGPSTVGKPIRTVKHFPHLITLHLSWAYSTPTVPSFDSIRKRQTTSELQTQILRRFHKISKCNLQCDTSFNRKFPETKMAKLFIPTCRIAGSLWSYYLGWQLRCSAETVHVNNFLPYEQWTVQRDSSVGTATRYALDGPGIGF